MAVLHTEKLAVVTFMWWSSLLTIQAFTEIPKFNQLKLLYPGYRHHGGSERDRDIIHHVLGPNSDLHNLTHPHNTAALRMSWTLNRYSGRHAIGNTPVFLSGEGRDSLTGTDGQEYIFRNAAFGPYLAAKYGSPVYNKTDLDSSGDYHVRGPGQLLEEFRGKQGIVRLLSYHKDHAGGHIALWDCNHFHQTRDWSTEHHVISVEFWQSPDSFCPPQSKQPHSESPRLLPLQIGSKVKVIARHSFSHGNGHRGNRKDAKTMPSKRRRHVKVKETLWIQKDS